MSNNISGNLFVIAAPSGAGKTTLVKALVEATANITISISHTTRLPRPLEVDTQDYFFIDQSVYDAMVEHDEFLEYATVYGNRYGTSKSWVFEQLSAGVDVILEIDWQGARQIHSRFPHAVLIFIVPPSLEALELRLQRREQDDPSVIESRMHQAQAEIAHAKEFDYLVVNDQFDQALLDLQHIVFANRLGVRTALQKQAGLLANLLEKQ